MNGALPIEMLEAVVERYLDERLNADRVAGIREVQDRRKRPKKPLLRFF